MSDSVTQSRSSKPIKQTQLPSTPQIVVRHLVDASHSQPQSVIASHPTESLVLPHAPTIPAAISESACTSQPALSVPNLAAVPQDQLHSPASVNSDDCRITEQNQGCQSSTSLSAAQWPCEIQTSQIRLQTHVHASLPVMSRFPPHTRHPIADKSSLVALPQSQSTISQCDWKGGTLDPEIPVAGALLAAMKRKATEEVSNREAKRRR
ncbi:hypothetical protein JB92DRAFT_860413 [Gautieria morchelliformis]|nr:hypothetical protein JB92DRAFT_860413 [Gautieria morchelliformis]